MSALLERLGAEVPIVQAGMGGGIATHELAGAVSDAGGLGTIGIRPAEALAGEIAAFRRLTPAPVAVNLLLPFARSAHWLAASKADVVVTFWGRPRRRTERPWVHQCGSLGEALAAHLAGADGVIAQGVEAGGHVRGTTPALELLERLRAALPAGYPILLAGGIADRADVERALAAGADAAVLGTRFLMSAESRAHLAYKQRLMEARETVLTELFGVSWPRAPHRVVWNEAAERWLVRDRRGPRWVRALNTLTAPVAGLIAGTGRTGLLARQSARLPLYSPQPPTRGLPGALLDSGPLYAGESVARIHDVPPAREIVRALTP